MLATLNMPVGFCETIYFVHCITKFFLYFAFNLLILRPANINNENSSKN